MTEILAMATAIVAVTLGVTEAIKKTQLVRRRYVPVVAIVLGVALGASATFLGADLVDRLWAGGISGLAATGLFEGLKNAKGDDK